MNSRERRKAEAISHNKALDEKKAIEIDRKNNPEKYAPRKRTKKENIERAQYVGMLAALGVL